MQLSFFAPLFIWNRIDKEGASSSTHTAAHTSMKRYSGTVEMQILDSTDTFLLLSSARRLQKM